MHIYQTQKDIEKDIKDGVLTIDEDVKFKCSFKIEAELKVAGDITAWNIDAWNITARDITARDIDARNIIARNIDARNIDAWNIIALNIDAWNIDAWNIIARNIIARNIIARNIIARNIIALNIDAGDISFWACVFAEESFKCRSIVGRRNKSKYFCLDSEVEINPNKLKKES